MFLRFNGFEPLTMYTYSMKVPLLYTQCSTSHIDGLHIVQYIRCRGMVHVLYIYYRSLILIKNLIIIIIPIYQLCIYMPTYVYSIYKPTHTVLCTHYSIVYITNQSQQQHQQQQLRGLYRILLPKSGLQSASIV